MPCCGLTCLFSSIGGFVFIYYVCQFIQWVRVSFFLRQDLLKRYSKKGTPWAVVTGASDGIGKALAIECGKRGLNVLLISRTKSKLEEVAAQISKKVQTQIVVFDFSAAGKSEYESMARNLDGLDIAVLINNVGINYDHPDYFDNVGPEQDEKLVKVNIESQNRMTQLLYSKLKARRSGAIINLSSMSAHAPIPLLAVYAATKAYNRSLSHSIAIELKDSGIDVMAVCPNMVISNMSKVTKTSFIVVTAESMAEQTLNKLGFVSETAGHWQHDVIEFGIKLLVCLMPTVGTNAILSQTKSLRAKALKKI